MICGSNTATLPRDSSYNALHNAQNQKSIILMQFTGLHDKNGVEIYEGDIIQWFNGTGLIGKPKVVKSTDGGWNPFIDSMQTDGSWHYEVIGNIYQDSHLLDKSNE